MDLGFKNRKKNMGHVIQKLHEIYICAMDIAHSGIQKPEEEHVLRDSKTAWVGF